MTRRNASMRGWLARTGAMVLALVALAFVTGCGSHLVGTNDVELVYSFDPRAPFARDVRVAAMTRLAAGRVSADVENKGGRIEITVDQGSADTVDELLTWRGGLAVYRIDPHFVLAPRDPTGLTAGTEVTSYGTVEHYFTGSRAALLRAARDVPASHRLLLEPAVLPAYRTRVVFATPAAELFDSIHADRGDEATVNVSIAPGSPAERAYDALYDMPHERFALARARTVLGVASFESRSKSRAPIVLSFGKEIESYTRAHRARAMLNSPPLPALVRVEATRLPVNWLLATLSVVVPILLSFGWLFFVRRFDRAYPEPMWLILVTFVLGGLSVVPAGLLEWGLSSISPYANPILMTFGGQPAALPLAVVVFTVTVGLSEEGSKLLGALFASRRREFDEPVDGIIYGVVSSLGFAAVENVQYFATGRLAPPLVAARAFMSIPAHMFFGALWGYALGYKLVSKRTSLVAFVGLAALGHGAFDALLSTDGMSLFAIALNVALASVFILLLQRALRHGVITKGMIASSRQLFRVGRPGLFALSSIALHVLALAILLAGAHVQMARYRVTYTFLSVSTSLVALLGVAAWAIAATLPLDVALDDYGVTFAGAARPWANITGIERVSEAALVLRSSEGDVRLGPGSPGVIESLARAIEARLAAI